MSDIDPTQKKLQEPESEGAQQSEQPVVRLTPSVEKSEKIEAVNLGLEEVEEAPSLEVIQEEGWGDQNTRVGRWVLVWGFILTVMLIGMIGVIQYIAKNSAKQVVVADVDLFPEAPYKGTPEQWFREKGSALKNEAVELVKNYLSATDRKAKSQFVRNPEHYLEHSPHWTTEFNPRLGSLNKAPWAISHTGQTGFFILEVEDDNFSPMTIYFTRHGEGLKIDWLASTAWAQVSLKEFKEMKPSEVTEPVLVRCLLRRKNDFYTTPYNDRDHASFMVISPDSSLYLWAYVDRESDLDKELRKVLNHGRFVVDLKKDVRVTLRLKKGEGGSFQSQAEVVGLVHQEWINPNE